MGGIIIALVFFIVSIVFALINNEIRGASLWALWAIFACLFFGAHFEIAL